MIEQAAGALRGGENADGTIASLIPLFVGRTVLVLGDVMLDRYVSGEVSRISPEAPIPVLRITGSRATLGGAANVAYNVAALGARDIRRQNRCPAVRDTAPADDRKDQIH